MKHALSIILAAAALLASVSCSKHSSGSGNPFDGKWYVTNYLEVSAENGEQLTQGTGDQYWVFSRKKGTVVLHDAIFPELGGGPSPKAFSYDSESRTLTVDGFSYEVLLSNSTNLRLRSHFAPELWSRDSHIVISFQRTTKGLQD
jgi:hypothetical protein